MKESMSTMKLLSNHFEGEFIERKYDEEEKVKLIHNGFSIVFDYYINYSPDNSEDYFTRVMVPFKSEQPFLFKLTNKDLFARIQQFFDKNSIDIDHINFNKKYYLSSNNGFKAKTIFTNKEIIEVLNSLNKFTLTISNDKEVWGEKLPNGYYELSFFTNMLIKEMNQFDSLKCLFILLITELQKANQISPYS
jgi:hypothetical protein